MIIGIGERGRRSEPSKVARLVIDARTVMQPWTLSNTDSKFLSVMGSYAIFLAPLSE